MSFSYCRQPLSYCMLTGPLLCRKRDRRFLMPLLIKAAMQSGWGSPTLTTSSEPGHLPKAPAPNTITLRSDVSTRVLREESLSSRRSYGRWTLQSHCFGSHPDLTNALLPLWPWTNYSVIVCASVSSSVKWEIQPAPKSSIWGELVLGLPIDIKIQGCSTPLYIKQCGICT